MVSGVPSKSGKKRRFFIIMCLQWWCYAMGIMEIISLESG